MIQLQGTFDSNPHLDSIVAKLKTTLPRFGKLTLGKACLKCLQPSGLLNDECINFYLALLKLCSTPNIIIFSSFFMTKLFSHKYKGISSHIRVGTNLSWLPYYTSHLTLSSSL
jgi:Ulp1 family protease